MRYSRFFLTCCFACVLLSSPAELILTNFSATRPLKVMPIGDSITDDCVVNGAWRMYLQPLLESNGYSFTFVGRESSIASPPSFTKVNHEGHCGAVIGPPGVYAVHGYSTSNAYLLKIVADALAVTNNRPDLVLLVIGVNDIGHGRDPYQVATNDMSQLLDLILTSVPGVNIILAKITSLQSANLTAANYAAYATNVPIYNAALQATVNQRRASGQNVFLADMFSSVDYNTMFLTDHVHPNTIGLKAMASEWLSRIQAITVAANPVFTNLLHGGQSWRYSDIGQDLGTNWYQISYDDSGWKRGPARLGYGDPAVATAIGFGDDPTNKYITTYFRHTFQAPWNLAVTNLNVRLAHTGGVVVWLNGQELFRTNLLAGPVSFTNRPPKVMIGYTPYVFYPTNIALAGLSWGTNVIAVEVHQNYPASQTLGFDMELFGSGSLLTAPPLQIVPSGTAFNLSWPSAAGNYWVYSTTNLALPASWSGIDSAALTNAGQVTIVQSPNSSLRFFRLQQQ